MGDAGGPWAWLMLFMRGPAASQAGMPDLLFPGIDDVWCGECYFCCSVQ
jgi:hypothetical protein